MQQDTSRNKLPIAIFLDHYATKTGQRLICSIASVCKEWNTAVQHADTRALNVLYRPKSPPITLSYSPMGIRVDGSLVSIALWLPKYAKLVNSIEISPVDEQQFRTLASPLLQQSLQAAAERGLKLRSCITSAAVCSTFWQALPSVSLTCLQIQGALGAELAASLPQLCHLETLDVQGDLAACLPAYSQLSKLTSLTLACSEVFATRQLPAQLRRLLLRAAPVLRARDCPPQQYDLAHLTQLTSLELSMGEWEYRQANSPNIGALPDQLVKFTIKPVVLYSVFRSSKQFSGVSATTAFQLTRLCRLERLEIHKPLESNSELLELAKLPRLQVMSLHATQTGHHKEHPMVQASSAWPQIHQLQELVLLPKYMCNTHFPHILNNIAACTGLTHLAFGVFGGKPDDNVEAQAGMPIDFTKCISRLQKLKALHYQPTPDATFWSGEAQYLSGLTSLTALILRAPLHNVEVRQQLLPDAIVIASLLQLKKLQYLRVHVHGITSDLWPVIGAPTELRYLEIDDLQNAFEAQSCASGLLSYLCNLKKLISLVGFEKCNKDALTQFWDKLHS